MAINHFLYKYSIKQFSPQGFKQFSGNSRSELTNIDGEICYSIPEAVNKLALSACLSHSCETGWNKHDSSYYSKQSFITFSVSKVEPTWLKRADKASSQVQKSFWWSVCGPKDPDVTCIICKYIHNRIKIPHTN